MTNTPDPTTVRLDAATLTLDSAVADYNRFGGESYYADVRAARAAFDRALDEYNSAHTPAAPLDVTPPASLQRMAAAVLSGIRDMRAVDPQDDTMPVFRAVAELDEEWDGQYWIANTGLADRVDASHDWPNAEAWAYTLAERIRAALLNR